ncbi:MULTISPECIES: hypothetical protein [Mycobacteroides]|jgi:hypothetical protein|uniref:Uncharacterized protein n=1 Tax=Mycobacteroides chelonae TaxID=1774 RepID=A0A0E3XPH8_MYCCH|nr:MULTISPECIES: hypothetical protein [Mycobacteroides]AMW20273.1 hypothetical protein Chelonae_p2522 [Mycobacterium sp. QIA-37]PKQ58621.1 hypothetical protein B5566_07225 [Mycobacterium sp. MHSD3]SKL81669.1 Uncharacterised protein [Mycobacteroides abscessus subsp. bolletii]VEG17366.1 Uncharacterised protein [Mycolicibacterium phlei]AKC39282.1 hypothetical protein GR01_12950 [Mycobacteroides chelonae]
MTDEAQPADKQRKVSVPSTVHRALTAFVKAHHMPTKAVLQPIGQAGVRITLVGADGILGDQVVTDLATAHAAVEAVEGIEAVEEWDRELVSTATPAPGHAKKMAGWVART